MNKSALAALFLSLIPLSAQDQSPLFRTTSELVLLDVQVLRAKTGTPAGELQAKDLRYSRMACGRRSANSRGTNFRCQW